MNRSYKSVFNRKTGVCQVVSERTRNAGKTGSSVSKPLLAMLLGLYAGAGMAQSSPIDGGPPTTITSTWSVGGDLTVGNTRVGILNIKDGGKVTNIFGYIGMYGGSNGTATVTGPGSAWENSDALFVGSSGTGLLNIENGGKVTNTYGYIGFNSSGTATVTGPGSIWENSSNLYVGNSSTGTGTGTLNIENGGKVTNTAGYLGRYGSSNGTAIVTGTGSIWENSSALYVGWSGTGNLNIKEGGKVTNTVGYIGTVGGSNGTATVTGDGSLWENSGGLYVGFDGTGNLNITAGGKVTSTYGIIGYQGRSNGTATVTGPGSLWQNSADLYVGIDGTGILNIEDEGRVASPSIMLGSNPTASGTLNLNSTGNARGVLSTAYIAKGTGTATLDWNGGILQATANESNYLRNLASSDIVIGSNGAYFDTNGFAVGINNTAGILAGSGGLTKLGAGTLSIIGSNTYSGDTTVSAGTLQFNSYTQSASQTLNIGASGRAAGQYGQLNVIGTATFNPNAHINVDVATINTLGSNPTLSGVITAGTLNASSFDVTDNSALFNFRAVINNNRVDLLTGVNSSTGIQDAMRGNGARSGLGAAQVLDGLVNGGATGDMSNVMSALGQLSNNRHVSRAVTQTLPLVSGNQAIQGTLGAFQNVIKSRNGGGTGLSSGDALMNKQAWARGFGSRAEQDDRNGASGFSADSWGMAFGADADVAPDARFGLAYGYAKTSVDGNTDLSGTAQRANIDSHVVAAYGSKDIGNARSVAWQADVGVNGNKSARDIDFGGLKRTATADYRTYSAHAGASIAQQIALSEKTTVTPALRADYTWLKSQAYNETGADALNLNVASDTTDALLIGADANLQHRFSPASRIDVNFGIAYDAINKSGNIVAAYAGAPGQAFATSGIDHLPWVVRGGIGYVHTAMSGTEINLRYDAEGRTGYVNQTASVRAKWAF